MAFATPSDLGRFLGRTLTEDEVFRAQLLLDVSTQAIRTYCRQTISRVTSDSAILHGNWTSELTLPERPVISVTSVTVSTTSLTVNTDYVWDGQDKLYRGTREYLFGDDPYDPQAMRHELHWGGPASQVTVVYTHGFADGSADLNLVKGICLDVVAAAFHTTPGIKQESIGQYSYTADRGAATASTLSADHRRQLRYLRR